MNWRLVAIPVTLIPIFIIAFQFDIKLADILAIGVISIYWSNSCNDDKIDVFRELNLHISQESILVILIHFSS